MNTPGPHWEHFEHKADIGIRGVGASAAQAFEQAAIAMTAIVTEPRRVEARDAVELHCEEDDLELLLVDWLNAIVYEMATRRMLFGAFEVAIDDGVLQGRARGERVEVARHEPAVEVKGATYTELKVFQREDGAWVAQCVVDV